MIERIDLLNFLLILRMRCIDRISHVFYQANNHGRCMERMCSADSLSTRGRAVFQLLDGERQVTTQL